MKNGGGNTVLWGCFSLEDGKLERKIHGAKYRATLEKLLFQSARTKNLSILPKLHWSGSKIKNLNVLEWPT